MSKKNEGLKIRNGLNLDSPTFLSENLFFKKNNVFLHMSFMQVINQEDLMANWSLAIQGSPLFKIKPLS